MWIELKVSSFLKERNRISFCLKNKLSWWPKIDLGKTFSLPKVNFSSNDDLNFTLMRKFFISLLSIFMNLFYLKGEIN